MKTQHKVPLTFRFPNTEEIEVIHEIQYELSNKEIEDALTNANVAMFGAMTDALTIYGGDAVKLFALIHGICLLNAGQIDICINDKES